MHKRKNRILIVDDSRTAHQLLQLLIIRHLYSGMAEVGMSAM